MTEITPPDLPEIPPPLKGIQHYLKIALEHDKRDPTVSYWARLYALQSGLKMTTKTAAESNFLMKLMDWLEATKKQLADNETITNEVAAQAHLENWALKLFLYADKNDRAGNFNKNVIQSFYTAGLLYDVLTTFGELSEEAAQNRKYAKWKAAYIHNCLKNGETPVPGPMKEEGEDDDNSNVNAPPSPDKDLLLNDKVDDAPAVTGDKQEISEDLTNELEGESANPKSADDEGESEPVESGSFDEELEAEPEASRPPSTDAFGFPSVPGSNQQNVSYPGLPTPISQNPYNPAPTPTSPSIPTDFSTITRATEGVNLTPEQMNKVSKYIKWAGSAANYDDVPTTIENLQKALRLLITGEDS